MNFSIKLKFKNRKEHLYINLNDDMVTVIKHACQSLIFLYRNRNNISKSNVSKREYQNLVYQTQKIIKDFIKKYPDHWKLMEVQYPLMACLIHSRSFSLIKYILFGDESEKSSLNLKILNTTKNNQISSEEKIKEIISLLTNSSYKLTESRKKLHRPQSQRSKSQRSENQHSKSIEIEIEKEKSNDLEIALACCRG